MKPLRNGFFRKLKYLYLSAWVLFSLFLYSCNTDPYGSNWNEEGDITICQFLELHREEYSKSYRLLSEGKMLTTLCAYNPYGEGYTLFLPTDEAIDRFITENPRYDSFEEMLQDTGFIYPLTRYHVLKRKVHTDYFPFGALTDSTLTGDRLSVNYYTDGDNRLIKINNAAPVTRSDLNMLNGYIHVVSEVLQKSEIKGYDWLQQQQGYSILAGAMQLSKISDRLWWDKYTLLVEHDSIYNRYGIYSAEDLVKKVASKGTPITNVANSFYRFIGYHIIGGEYYLNDFQWGRRNYPTFGSYLLEVEVGMDIRFNPGVDTYGYEISETGDTLVINYLSPLLDESNIMTATGPVHSVSDLLHFLPMPR